MYVHNTRTRTHTHTHTHLPRYYCHLFFYIFKMILSCDTYIIPVLSKEVVFKFKHFSVALILLSIFWYSVLPDHGLFQPKNVSKFPYI